MKALLRLNMLKNQNIGENCLTGKSELSKLVEIFDDSKEKRI